MQNVTKIARTLCNQCGICVSVCPVNAIKLKRDNYGNYFPVASYENKCIACQICLNICPGLSVDFNGLNKEIFGRLPDNYYVGNYNGSYLGYSNEPDIRLNSSSGGIVTSVAIHALETGLVNGVLVVKNNDNDPFIPQVFVAKNKWEIYSAMQSKYFPVPMNIGLKQILREPGKFAVIGLPCHIHGVRKAELKHKKLKDKIKLRIGLFCHMAVNIMATHFLLDRLKVDISSVTDIKYREGKWPGKIVFKLSEGKSQVVQDITMGNLIPFFAPLRCTFCIDFTNELADLSVGDAWNLNLEGSEGGWASIISRTELGQAILYEAQKNGKLSLNEFPIKQLIHRSHRGGIYFKKIGFKARKRLRMGGVVPIYKGGLPPDKAKFNNHLHALLLYFNLYLSKNKIVRKMIKYLPVFLLKSYTNFLSLLNRGISLKLAMHKLWRK